jgi:hypothetical protein
VSATVGAIRDERGYGLASAELLKLRKRRGLTLTVALATIGPAIPAAIAAILHAVNPAHYGTAGGIENLGHAMLLLNLFGAVAATVVGASAGADDLKAGIFRELVMTGRSRLTLFAARIPGGLAFLLPFVAGGFAIVAAASATAHGPATAPSLGLLGESGVWMLLETSFYFLLGLALGSLTGSRAYSIGALLAWRLILSRILISISSLGAAREIIPDVHLQALAPHAVARYLQEATPIRTSLDTSIGVLVLWALVSLGLSAFRSLRSDA